MYVLGIGAANVDVHGMSRAAIVMADSNPATCARAPEGLPATSWKTWRGLV